MPFCQYFCLKCLHKPESIENYVHHTTVAGKPFVVLTDLGGFSLFCHSQAAPEYISILHETAEQNPCNRFLPEGFQLHELVCYSVIPHISRAVLKKINKNNLNRESFEQNAYLHTCSHRRSEPLKTASAHG